MTRFYHAFKWQTVLDVIKERTKGIVLLASASSDIDSFDEDKIIKQLTPEDKGRTHCFYGSIYRDCDVQEVISVANKPLEQTWADFYADYSGSDSFGGELSCREDALPITALILIDCPNRTKNLHKILAATKLTVISTTCKYVKRPTGKKDADGDELIAKIPDVSQLYGRPSLKPDFGHLTDEVHDLYSRDGVVDLDCLIPVYDFSVQSFSHKQMIEQPAEQREPVVLLNDQPMLWAESITELFAWRGTGKTMFSLGLGLHIAAGKDMPGLTITKPRKVLYVEGELPASQLTARYNQMSAGLDIPDDGFTMIAKSMQSRARGQSPVTIKTETGRLAIEAEIEKTGTEVLFIDSIASLAQINTNNEEQWLPIIEWMVELRCKGICVVYLQQAGKGRGAARPLRFRRSHRPRNQAQSQRTPTPTEQPFEMSFTKEREGSLLPPLRLTCTKGVWALDGAETKAPKTRKTSSTEVDREQEIMEAIESGEPQREIARRFKTSLRTVNQLKNKKEKTNDDTNHHVDSQAGTIRQL